MSSPVSPRRTAKKLAWKSTVLAASLLLGFGVAEDLALRNAEIECPCALIREMSGLARRRGVPFAVVLLSDVTGEYPPGARPCAP